LEDPELPLRVTAAGALSGEGVVESIPVLIEALGSDEELWYSDPPRPAADLAREALEAYTGEAFATPEEWEAWWGEVRGSLRWDGERYVEA
jgi:HEAT repeat protein